MNGGTIISIAAVGSLIAIFILLYNVRPAFAPDVASSTVEGTIEKGVPRVTPPTSPPPTPRTKAPTPVPSTDTSFKEVFNQAGAHACEYSQVTSSGQSNYRIYISGDKMRGEFYSLGQTGKLVIYDGSLLYSWSEGASVGAKAPLTSLAQIPVAIPSDLQSGAVYGSGTESVSWDCHPWIPDTSLFTPPSYVSFK